MDQRVFVDKENTLFFSVIRYCKYLNDNEDSWFLDARRCIDDGNGSENVSFKMNSRFFNLCRVYSNLLKMASVGEFR